MTRVGASQAFFNIVAHMNAKRLISDVASLETIMKAVSIDTFEAMMKPFDEFGQMIQQARAAVEQLGVDVGNAMIEFEKFFGSGVMMQDVATGVIEVGEAFAMTATESLAAASRAAQVANIIGQANVELLVEQAMILAEISDLNVEESQRALIKLQQQANIMYGEYTAAQVRGLPLEMQRQVLLDNTSASLDALNTIANRSVALEGDLVQTMTNFASQGNLVGESFEFMAAASATLLEAGEEQGTAGRALRMMYARLGGNISGAADQIEALGIKVRDNNGNMLTMQEVLGNVSAQGWDTMSASLKMNIAQTISGNRHYVRFIKLMDNYERTVRLAAEGQMGLDSATTQAERALSRQSKQLEISQARMENLKATIGQQLTPAFIESNNVQSEYLEQVSLLINGTGGLGKAFGRLAASLQITGGFVKFGLALQSVGIGFGMYESVMKSLHDIEIANTSLHSKQATYMDYAVTATKEQESLLKIMQYLQQRMNANSEQSRLHQLEINHILQQRREIEQVLTPLQEKYNTNLTKRANISQEITSLNILQTDLAKRQMSSYQTKLAFMEHDKRIGGDLLERQKQLYSERTFSEEAYKRQFISDVTTMNNLRKGDIKNIVEGNEKLRQRHSALQDLKAANEAARAARDENDKGVIRTAALKKKDSQAMIDFITREQKLVGGQKGRATKAGDKQMEAFYANRLKGLRQFKKEVKNMEQGLFRVGTGGMQKAGFDEMTNMLKETGGAIIQSDRVLQAYNSNLIKHGTIERQLSILQGMKTKTNNGLKFDLSKINQLTADDIILQQQLEPLMDRINQMDEEKIESSKEYIAVTRILQGVEKDKAAIMEKYSRDDKVRADEDMARRDMSMRQMTFAVTSLISVLGGASNSAFGVTASMVAMGSQIGFATGQVVKSTKSLIENSAKAAKNAGQFDDLASAQGYYTKQLAKTGVAILAVTAAITLFNKHQQEQQKQIERTRKEIEKLDTVMSAMEADTKLFGTEDGLAGQLGIANYELGELVNNADLTAQIFNTLNDESHGLDRNMQSVVENSINMLSTLMAIQEQSNIINASDLREAQREIDRAMSSLDFGLDTAFFGFGDDSARNQLLRDFFGEDTKLYQRTDDTATKILIDQIVADMKTGRELTEEQWYLLEDALGDNKWAEKVLTNLEKIDKLTMSEEMLDIVTRNLTENNNALKQSFVEESEAVNNLEEDIRNFANTREELFFGGKYGNITGSLYKQVVQQGVGVLYNKQEVIVSNVFHGFFNEQEAADRIKTILKAELATM